MNNKKILVLGGVSGMVASLATTGIDSWLSALAVAVIIGALIGLLGAKVIFKEEN